MIVVAKSKLLKRAKYRYYTESTVTLNIDQIKMFVKYVKLSTHTLPR